MGKNKKKKPTEVKEVVKKVIKMKTSYECEQCKNQCVRGLNYIHSMTEGRVYYGVVCYA